MRKKEKGTLSFGEMYGRFLDTSSIKKKKLDIGYAQDEECRFDIYYPQEGNEPYPTIIFFHGGAFLKGDKGRYQLKPALNGIARGYAVISVGYRLVPDTPLPGAFDDADRAVNYIRKHAGELGIDPGNMVLWGESSGATLALVTGFAHPEGIRAIVDWYSAMALEDIDMREIPEYKGDDFGEYAFGGRVTEELKERINPKFYIGEGLPPVLIEHGTDDAVVDCDVSVGFHEALGQYLPPEECPLYLIDGGTHGVADYENEDNLALVFQFIGRHLTNHQ